VATAESQTHSAPWSALLRKNSYNVPWNWFVPDFVTKFTAPPAVNPNSADIDPLCTLNSSTASTCWR
jgi:hypothetical protein